jgi:hypothetical protein
MLALIDQPLRRLPPVKESTTTLLAKLATEYLPRPSNRIREWSASISHVPSRSIRIRTNVLRVTPPPSTTLGAEKVQNPLRLFSQVCEGSFSGKKKQRDPCDIHPSLAVPYTPVESGLLTSMFMMTEVNPLGALSVLGTL